MLIACIIFLFIMTGCEKKHSITPDHFDWPEIKNTTKPWTRWWWMGNIVDKKNIRQQLIDFQKSGIGGVEITPIYGVTGEEEHFIDHLSPDWMDMLDFTIKTADSLNMQVDMVLGTGWPYGGPHVSQEHAATKLITHKFELSHGDVIDKILLPLNPKDQNSAKLTHVLAYTTDGKFLDLTPNLHGNHFKWKADKDYTLYAVFTGKTRQQVKRAAPGGKGFTLDHYSKTALNHYLKRYDTTLTKLNGKLRAIFNDSYEVYGTDFTPHFFEAFKNRRGYDLIPHLNLLLDDTLSNISNRLRSDYRETLSDLLLEDFDNPWTNWANSKGYKSRLQAHGSPGNLIDLYASADIPECETFGSMPYDIVGFRREKEDIRAGDADPVMLKFSSSAAHISGKPLTSSETFTWLRDHFKTALSQCKPEAEDLLLNGINHIFLHGATYSPERATWPGWKFYASVNFNKNNTIWEDASALFSYLANCQSMLQAGTPDNETLLYWPIHDVWNQYLNGSLFFQFKIHALNEWLHNTPFYNLTKSLMEQGYGVDFISDNFIQKATVSNGILQLPGGHYKSLVIPNCNHMPLATLKKLIALKKEGANIIFNGLPETVPGFFEYEAQTKTLLQLTQNVTAQSDVFGALNQINVYPETLVNTGLKYIRRAINEDKIYYLVNHTPKDIDDFIPLETKAETVVIYDPLTKQYGKAKIKPEGQKTLVHVNIPSGGSLLLKTGHSTTIPNWNYYEATGKPLEITGDWNISFLKGGPELPQNAVLNPLKSWATLGTDAENFSGTARYEITFNAPDTNADNWMLNLGDVRESAKVWLNDKLIGTVWSAPFKLNIGKLQNGKNKLTIEVTNLAANRIRAKEMRGEIWKIFHEINMVNKDYKTFDATLWQPMPSGLLSPITITPLQLK